MASSTRSPARLPARVYWFRRLIVVGTALALVFAFAHLLSSRGDGGSGPAASTVAGTPTTTPGTGEGGPVGPTPGATPTARSTASMGPAVLAQPDGPCAADEVTVAPVEGSAPAGKTVPLVVQLTSTRPACTFTVNADTVVVKVSGSQGRIWSSQQCRSSIPRTTVVVRSTAPTTLQVQWSGRGSDVSCTQSTAWALPGSYKVDAAAIGSDPSTATVKLTQPDRPIVIKTVQPSPGTDSTAPTTPDTGH